jgi:uncharacterized Zn finger protein
MYYNFGWHPYVPMAQKRRNAERVLAKLKKRGQPVAPVRIDGRKIAASFWGQAWCSNLERYSDYENRLPRGRSYVRNGSVLDLQIGKGEITALVAGSKLYRIRVSIAPVARAHWKSICRDCGGSIDSLVELLQGRLAKSVMDRVCREGDGLFPVPDDINFSCSCPDWADMCKHVSAVLYGVGARLDQKPELLFVLRGVDEKEMIARAGQDLSLSKSSPSLSRTLDDTDVAALFGLEMAETAGSGGAATRQRRKSPKKVSNIAVLDASAAARQPKRSKPFKLSKPPTKKPKATKAPVRNKKERTGH